MGGLYCVFISRHLLTLRRDFIEEEHRFTRLSHSSFNFFIKIGWGHKCYCVNPVILAKKILFPKTGICYIREGPLTTRPYFTSL
jgi:hypothetical protein